MRKKRLTVLTGVVVVFLFSFVTPIQAGPPKTAEGGFTYYGTGATERWAGCNLFLTITEIAEWTGTFTGWSEDEGKAVLHCNGDWSVNEIMIFEEVVVDGKTGGLILSIVGSRPNGVLDWYGHWVIIEGTGGLANLRGQGNWYGPGAPDPFSPGLIEYDGKYHFEPN
ncbi:MAG: hypothetical protein ACYTBY_10975 [Planctomycetota bacterium]|jgi:hypothetical protein